MTVGIMSFAYFVSSPNVCLSNGRITYNAALEKRKHAPQGQVGGNMPRMLGKGKHAPQGLEGGNMLWGGPSGQFRLG